MSKKRDVPMPEDLPLHRAPPGELIFRLENLRRNSRARNDTPSRIWDWILAAGGVGLGALASGEKGWNALKSPHAIAGGGAGLAFGPLERAIGNIGAEVQEKSMKKLLAARIRQSMKNQSKEARLENVEAFLTQG